MDWLRRNWPDLLIGIALVAVIAGIIATLITGGSFFPVGQNTRTNSSTTQNSTTQSVAPKTPSAPATSANSSSDNGSATSGGSQQSAGNGNSQASTAGAGGESGGTPAAPSNGGVSVLPPSGSGSESGGTASSGATSGAASGASSGASSANAPSGGASASSATAAPSGQAATAANGPGSAAPYRISVGAFSHKDYAQRQEQVFKQAGYPAFLASQGDLTIVLVGPYQSQSEAEQVAGKIKGGGYGVDPVVYQFQGSTDHAPQPAGSSAGSSGSSSGGSQSAAAAGSPAASSGSTSSASAAAPSGEQFLQVGAYGSSASAKPQRDRLAGMGFSVQERTENGLIKLLIGPFGPDRLQQVQSQLKSSGIDSFPR